MATWNLRIIYHDSDKYPWYGVHEVFYNENLEITNYTINSVDISGESEEEVKNYINMIQKDINRAPILIKSEIVCVGYEIEDEDGYGEEYNEFDNLEDFMNTLDDSTEIK